MFVFTKMSTQGPDLGNISAAQPIGLDKKKGDETVTQDAVLDPDLEQPVAPDQFDNKYQTSKWEIWAYYTCVPRGCANSEN